MAERTNALVLKTSDAQASGGSNPPPSALTSLTPIGCVTPQSTLELNVGRGRASDVFLGQFFGTGRFMSHT